MASLDSSGGIQRVMERSGLALSLDPQTDDVEWRRVNEESAF